MSFQAQQMCVCVCVRACISGDNCRFLVGKMELGLKIRETRDEEATSSCGRRFCAESIGRCSEWQLCVRRKKTPLGTASRRLWIVEHSSTKTSCRRRHLLFCRKLLKTHLFNRSFPKSPVVPTQWLRQHCNRFFTYLSDAATVTLLEMTTE